MKINKMKPEKIQKEIDKLKTPIDRVDGKRTKGDESPSRRFQHLSDRLHYLTMTKAIIILAMLLLGSVHATNIYVEVPKPPKKTIKARITAYWLGEDEFGWKSSTGKRLVSGKALRAFTTARSSNRKSPALAGILTREPAFTKR